jgi:glycosyltransferase involved in cell wall biosynthesis
MMPVRDAAQVITIHDLDFFKHPERTRAEIRRDYPLLAKSHAERADRILVPSQHTASEVQKLFGIDASRISICAHGAPAWTPRASVPPNPYILFVGTLEPRKNVGVLLDAYARLVTRHATFPPLVLAGAATEAAQPWLGRLAKEPLAGKARHLGYVEPDDRPALYSQAAMLVLPSFDEGFGLPALEAMTVGVPVVAANRGALPEVLGDAGLLIEPEDAEGLAAAIERLVFDEAFARAAAAKGLDRSRQFTWSATADAVLQGYKQAIEARARRKTSVNP